MQVKCSELRDIFGNIQTKSKWLTVGKIYLVLSLTLSNGRWLVRVKGDSDPGLGLFPMDQFTIVDPRLPKNWIAVWHEKGAFELTTEAWSKPSFWEKYYEHDEEAKRIFERDSIAIGAVES